MSGFIRRFSSYPGTETITQIEGVNIIDLPPPGSITGVNTGVVAVVGEFPDMTYATAADGAGIVTTNIQPVAVTSAADMLDKVGGFDETIGDFGRAGGNGYVALRNKRFSGLVIAPVNLASAVGCRLYRQLPLCSSQADTLPAVPMQGGVVQAGREFRNAGAGRLRIGKRVIFTAFDVITAGTAGQLLAGSSAATQTLVSGSQALQVWQVSGGGITFGNQTTTFNDATAANFLPFNTTEATGDYVAFGLATTFNKITLSNVGGTVGVGGVVVWEYWNGSAWTALTVSDGTNNFTAASSSNQVVSWTPPLDWTANTLNSVLAFYVRARCTTVWSTNPTYTQGFIGGVDWTTISRSDGGQGALKGDIIVVGYNNAGASAPAAEAGTYRVATAAAAGIYLTVERLDGANFVWTAQANVPWRMHVGSDADSAPVVVLGATTPGGYDQNDPGGFSVPVRPLTNATGGSTDGNYTVGELCTPVVVPPAVTGDTADALSGLQMRLHPVTATAFTAALQAPNAANTATIDAAYATALDGLVSDIAPISDINIVFCARTSTTIRSLIKQHVASVSTTSMGRIGVIRPELTVITPSAVTVSTDPGVGTNRLERIIYAWPGAQTYIPEAVNYRLKVATGLTTVDGVLDVGADGFVASVMSNLPPERNIGQAQEPVPGLLSGIRGIQRGVGQLGIQDYTALRDRGVVALRIDRSVGSPIFQSGVTTSLIAGEKTIARRRMADFIQDSIARRLNQFCKLPKTQANKDAAATEVDAFLQDLRSIDNPATQRIEDYAIDTVSGNTPTLEAKGIFVLIIRVRTLATMDFIVLQTEISPDTVITRAA